MLILLHIIAIIASVEMAVLDPALYLAPSPPIKIGKDYVPSALWSQKSSPNAEHNPNGLLYSTVQSTEKITSIAPDILETAETFWPSLRSIKREIHIPLTFHLTGTYGGYDSGVIASRYMNTPEIKGVIDNFGKSGLAGSSYGSYWGNSGVKIYGGNSGPSWGGWGNGKWGHYGKG